MDESLYRKDVEQCDGDSSDESIAQRSSREMSESLGPDLSSITDASSSVQRTAADSAAGPRTSGPDTRGQYEQRYGVDIDTPGQADRLQRLEQSNTLPHIQRWADEGIPIDAMGTPSKMEAYRSRKGTPVPWDLEQRNEASKRRNTSALQRSTRESPAGETQVPESVRDVVSAPGQPVNTALRKPVEPEIGQSLDHARVHRSPAADAACDELNARAFTVDNHVAVRSDQPDPGTPAGQHLMSHELTHVAQQTGGAVSLLPDAGALEVDPDPKLEQEAEETAQRVMQGGDLGIQRLQDTDVHIQRMPDMGDAEELEDFHDAIEDQDGFESAQGLHTQYQMDKAAQAPVEEAKEETRQARQELELLLQVYGMALNEQEMELQVQEMINNRVKRDLQSLSEENDRRNDLIEEEVKAEHVHDLMRL